MKCEKCNHEAVKIKKNHFCPSCGKKVLSDKIDSNLPKVPVQAAVSSDNSNKVHHLEKRTPNVLNLKDSKKDTNASLTASAESNTPSGETKKEPNAENVSSRIKSIIEKHTEPKSDKVKTDLGNVNQTLGKASLIEAKNTLIAKVSDSKPGVSQVKAPENIFSKKEDKVFWDKPTDKNSLLPTKKEQTLKKMLVLVVGLNILVILGIVYLLLT
jgi:hypothetical protein